MILCFRAELGYKNPSNAFILLKNLVSALVDEDIIDKKLLEDHKNRRVEEVINPTPLFISFLLGLVPKYNGSWRKIHHLSHLVGRLVNNHIPDGVGERRYSQF